MNIAIISGNVAQKYDNGTNIRLSIADTYKDKTTFIPVFLYDSSALFAQKYIKIGDHISVEGRLSTYRNNQNKDVLTMIATRVSFEGYKNPNRDNRTSYTDTSDMPVQDNDDILSIPTNNIDNIEF